MGIMSSFKDLFTSDKYRSHPEAIIISCFFNPMNSPYRLKAFNQFYETIKHMNHRITECIVGNNGRRQLPANEHIDMVRTENMLWHKEALLNRIVKTLPSKYKYIFWVDADVLFTNKDWMVLAVEQLQKNNILQPFEFCVHLERDEDKPSFDLNDYRYTINGEIRKQKSMWRSFSANYVTTELSDNENYDRHGHVGFAWGAKRRVLEGCPLYDKALIGGADHIIAHAAAGHIPHPCITKSFSEDLENVLKWSKDFNAVVKGQIGYVKGDLYHLWHGDIDKRQYLKRIVEFTPKTKEITDKDKNGLYVTHAGDDAYVKNYFQYREVPPTQATPPATPAQPFQPKAPMTPTPPATPASPSYPAQRPVIINRTTVINQRPTYQDDGFLTSMALGYMTDSTIEGALLGGNIAGAAMGAMMKDSQQSHVPPPAPVTNIYLEPQGSHPHTLNVDPNVPIILEDPIDNTNSVPHASSGVDLSGNFS